MATVGYGSTFGYGTDGTNFTNVAQVIEMSAPAMKVTDVDTSHNGITAGVKEFTYGLVDPGEADMKLSFDKTEFNTLKSYLRSTKYWRVQVPDATNGSKWIFQGHINSIATPVPLDDRITADVKIKVTGAVTFTAGT